MSNANETFKRKKLIIDPQLQGRLMRDCGAPPLVALVGGTLVVKYMLGIVRAEASSQDVKLPSLDDLNTAIVAFAVICGVIALYHALILSHRIAGPVYRLGCSIEDLVRGKTNTTVSLRRGDYLQKSADQFNRIVRLVRDKDAEIERLRSTLLAQGFDPADTADRSANAADDVDSAPGLMADAPASAEPSQPAT